MNITENKPSSLNIAILVRSFPNIVQTYVLNHILSLKEAGQQTLIIAVSREPQKEIHPAVQIYKLLEETLYLRVDSTTLSRQLAALLLALGRRTSRKTTLKILSSRIRNKYGVRYMVKALIRAKVLAVRPLDIVHSHSLFDSYDYLFLKEVFGIPFTTTFHGLVPNNVKMLAADKIRLVLEVGDAFFVNTRFARNQLTGFGCDPDKIHIIPQGTNTADFPFRRRHIQPDKPVIILSVGRLSIEKGFHISIAAVVRLKKRFPRLEYRIIGGGLEEQNLVSLITKLGAQDTVKLVGVASTEELRAHYNDAHIFVLPSVDLLDGSHTETQGVVLQEAQASGIPVIASRTGGIPEVIHDGRTGLLFDEKDEQQLADHIESLVSDKHLYQTVSMQGRKDVEENYSTEVVCERLLDIYRDILARNTGH